MWENLRFTIYDPTMWENLRSYYVEFVVAGIWRPTIRSWRGMRVQQKDP